MMTAAKCRKFETAEEVFEAYIPGYVSSTPSGGTGVEDPLGPEAGIHLAEDLLQKFRQRRTEKKTSGPRKS